MSQRGVRRTYPTYSSVVEPSPLKCPEVKLAIAVLIDAFELARLSDDRRTPTSAHIGSHVGQLRDEALAYFASDDLDWPYSFLNLCLYLNLDPQAVRAAVHAAPPRTGTIGEGRRSLDLPWPPTGHHGHGRLD